MREFRTIGLQPSYTEDVSPKRYLELRASEKGNIKSVEIIPPRLGGGSFGQIRITRKIPVYSSLQDKNNE